jgi:gliding motility-associated-like protein
MNAQVQVPARDTTFTINLCSGVDSLYSLPYFEPDVQYRWLPETGPVSDINSANTNIYYENTTNNVITFQYLLSRTYNQVSTYVDTISIRFYPTPNLTLQSSDFSLCPGDTGILNYIPQNNSYLQLFPSERTKLDTSIGSTRVLFWPESTINYEAYFYSQGGCRRGPFDIDVNMGAQPPVFSANFPDVLCENSDELKLNQYVDPPFLGEFSGPGVIDTVFYPGLVGVGQYPVSYTMLYLSCYFTVTDTITIVSDQSVTLTDLPNFCANDPKLLLEIGSPPGGEYSGTGVENGYFNPNISGPGTFELTYSLSLKEFCTSTATQNITVIPLPTKPTLTVSNLTPTCEGDSVQITSSFFTNYGWNTGENTQSIWVTEPGDYFVRIQSSTGCANYSDTLSLQYLFTPPIATLTSPTYPNGYNTSYNYSADGSIELTIEEGSAPFEFLWSNGATSQNLSNIFPGYYSVSITDTNGCSIVEEITLTSPDSANSIGQEPFDLGERTNLPNTFSPNGDGFNDTYCIPGATSVYAKNTFRVWNIQRQLVYQSSNYSNNWDGRDLKGDLLPEGTYFGVFECSKLKMPAKISIDLRYN